MHTAKVSRPGPPRRAATIDFIENRLPEVHPAFNHTHLQYDANAQRFVPTWTSSSAEEQIPSRPESAPVNAMKFWSQILPESMKGLKRQYPEPRGRTKTQYSIRDQRSWQGVCSQLEKARGQYDIPKRRNAKALFRKSYRDIAGKTDQLKTINKIAGQVDYISPFLVIVDILLDAAAMASQVREQVTKALDPKTLEDDFERIEFFLATFPRDPKIRSTSVDLVVAILKAIEDAIEFFLSHQVKRIWDSVTQGKGYQGALTASIKEIDRHSSRLASLASEANIHSNRTAFGMLFEQTGNLTAMCHANMRKVDHAILLADVRNARMMNMIKDLLQEAEDRVLRYQHESEEQEKRFREEQKAMLKSLCGMLSISLEISDSYRPTPAAQPQYQTIAMPTGFMASFMMPTPPPAWFLFPPWVVAPPPMPVTRDQLIATLGVHHNDAVDITHILYHRLQMPSSSRGRAEAAVSSPEFRRWLVSPSSSELLIQGDPDADGYELSGMSLITALVCSTLQGREGHVRVVWFCSLHDEDDDNSSSCSSIDSCNHPNALSHRSGGVAMLVSFITQMLHQHAFNFSLWPGNATAKDLHLQNLARGHMATLANLFEWLVRQLPSTTIFSIIIDEIGCYETDSYLTDMLTVLKLVLRLSRSQDVKCIMKVLATSSGQTDEVGDFFRDDEGCYLAFDALDEMEENGEVDDLDWGLLGDDAD
ncbi:uncharacterized protein BO88DRAFT_408554 [Aspergillus vadensis CBS 113365]|uniref:Uncharacterized protein n=1 Tax=Aspergillus vadensis (strain CBS 113365 / IMI 142717 / IBT 24658) TaxID=1448311 RepID=A0A319AVK2_ASPVC|nr:hypothetical protein BO88DRAFT_408554 [Aspergillus vadensis CBS 113365]PYH64406.1 hypothetical protein BO88DRAFT_408554 [Aspergillus vadensis CBS 113365]